MKFLNKKLMSIKLLEYNGPGTVTVRLDTYLVHISIITRVGYI